MTVLHQTERLFQDAVIDLAQLYRWKLVHFRPAQTAKGWRTAVQGDGIGWPDIFAVRDFRAIAVELKSEKGKLSKAQEVWLEALSIAGIETYCWKPSQWKDIEWVLK